MEILTHREVVSRGGKKRWANVSDEERSKQMKKVRAALTAKQKLLRK